TLASHATRDPAAQVPPPTPRGRTGALQGRSDSATDCLTRALQAAQAPGHRIGELTALIGLGWVHYMQGRYGQATDCHTRGLQTARAAGNRAGELTALNGLGNVHHVQGRDGPARAGHTRRVAD